jgi:hypothetical protein
MSNQLQMPTPRERAFEGLLGAFRADLGDVGTRTYIKALADIPDAKLFAGIKRAIQECPTFPSVATLREQCRLAQPVVEGVKFLPAARPSGDENDPTSWVNCPTCMDSGWRYTRVPHPAGYEVDAAYKCGCFDSNPRVRAGIGGVAR